MKEQGSTLLILMICAVARFANAGSAPILSDLRVAPNPAIAGQVVALQATARCARGPTESTVDIDGQVVTVRLTYVECPVPETPVPFALALGTFAPGNYTVRFIAFAGEFDPPLQDPPIDLPLVVAEAVPVGLPVDGLVALVGLAALLALFGTVATDRACIRNRRERARASGQAPRLLPVRRHR